jgi:hypothetical protein
MAHVDALTPLRHAENVTTRVFALEGDQTVLHHTSTAIPLTLFDPAS